MNFKENDVKFSKQREYDIVSLPGFSFMQDSLKVGEPMMPVKAIRVLLPAGTEVKSVRIISKIEKKLQGTYLIYPIQYPVSSGEGEMRKFVGPKKEIYTSNNNYPGKLVEFVSENYFREYHISEVLVYPVQYAPAKGELLLYTEMVVEIEYSTSAKYQPSPRLRRDEKKENKIKDQLKHQIVNPEDVSYNLIKPLQSVQSLKSAQSASQALSMQTASLATQALTISSTPSATEGLNVDYLIITGDSLVNTFQRLADWKTKKGLVATVKTVSWICANYSGCDPQEKIRHFIQDAYIKWGTDYVLLGGDVDIVPVRTNSGQTCGGVPAITDLYYSALNDNWNSNGNDKFGETVLLNGNYVDVDGTDYIADVWVGRAPVHTNTEANLFIDKVFTYERHSLNPALFPNISYLTKMLSLGGIVNPLRYDDGSVSCIWEHSGIYDKQMIKDFIPPSFTNYKMYEYYYDFDNMNGSFFISDRNENLHANTAISQIDSGYAIINHIDHSGVQAMGMAFNTGREIMTTHDVDALTNGNKYSVVISGGCNPGKFNYDCIGEHLILKNNGGAVAFIGGSLENWSDKFSDFDYNFFNELFKKDTCYNLGQTLASATDGLFDPYEKCIMNLLGDPEMPVWTDTLGPFMLAIRLRFKPGKTIFLSLLIIFRPAKML